MLRKCRTSYLEKFYLLQRISWEVFLDYSLLIILLALLLLVLLFVRYRQSGTAAGKPVKQRLKHPHKSIKTK